MSILTLGSFLIGSRAAILRIAATPGALGLGLLFVLSAGFAREYDGEDLLREPWHLLIPLGASLVSCTVLLLLLLVGSLLLGVERQNWVRNYRQFLTLFWMTAPLAWLYAIPVERFVSAGDAMRLNLALLGVVALWRVLLMIRVVSVMFGAKLIDAVFFVMLFSDSVALLAIEVIPKPVVSMMGGIRHTESEDILLATTCLITFFGALLLPVFALSVLAIVAVRRLSSPDKRWRLQFEEASSGSRVSILAWGLGAVSLVVWIGPLPSAQREQQLRSQVEQAFADGEVDKALRIMSGHEVTDFPPHYDPPPRIGYGQVKPPLMEVVTMALDDGAPWVVDIYAEKFHLHGTGYRSTFNVKAMDDDQLEDYINLLTRAPRGREVAKRHDSWVYTELHVREDKPELSERRRALLLRFEELLPPRPVMEDDATDPDEREAPLSETDP